MVQLSLYSYTFPNPQEASPHGVVAYGGDLNPNRIIKAYMNGIFPWYKEGDPILWWSPNPRLILELDEFKVSKSLQKTINQKKYEIRFDTNFRQVMQECSKIDREGQEGSWIIPEIVDAYCLLHEMGFAHSFEAYLDGELVGGGYGIALGNIFCGESMFAKSSDASKVAFYYLIQRLKEQNYALVDCQIPTDHLKTLGAREISRDEFLLLVKKSLENPREF